MNLKNIFKSIGTQEYVASLTGVSQRTVRSWVAKDSMPTKKLEQLMKASGKKVTIPNKGK